MTRELDVDVIDEPDRHRYAVYVDGDLAGRAEYELAPGRITFTHTVVDDRFEGRGVGSRLASGALDAARARGLRVDPQCPYIAAYIEHHPAYGVLVDQPSGS